MGSFTALPDGVFELLEVTGCQRGNLGVKVHPGAAYGFHQALPGVTPGHCWVKAEGGKAFNKRFSDNPDIRNSRRS